MSEFFEDFLLPVGGVAVGVVAAVFLFVVCAQWVDITFVDNIPSVVKVDGRVVYEGSSAGFDAESAGANTTVTVRGGFLFMFPKAYYVSNDVEVIGVKP